MAADLQALLECAEANLRRFGRLAPLVIIEGRDTTAILDVGLLWGPTAGERRRLLYRIGMLLGFGLDASRAIAVFDGYYRVDPGDVMRPLPASGSLEDDPAARDAIFVVEMKPEGGHVLVESYDKIVNLEATTFVFEPVVEGDGFSTGTFGEFWRGLREVEGVMRLGAKAHGETIERAREIVAGQFALFFPGVRVEGP